MSSVPDGWSGVGGSCVFTTGGTTCSGNRPGGEYQPLSWERSFTQPKDLMQQYQLIKWKDMSNRGTIYKVPSPYSYLLWKGLLLLISNKKSEIIYAMRYCIHLIETFMCIRNKCTVKSY